MDNCAIPFNHARLLRTSALTGLLLLLGGCDSPSPNVSFKQGRLVWNNTTVQLEIADSAHTRAIGLMFREQLPFNSGMWFEFEQESQQCMWMKNTLIDLDVAFVDKNYTVTNIEHMRAKTESPHCASDKVSFALEMNAGWFKQQGLRAGAVLTEPTVLQNTQAH